MTMPIDLAGMRRVFIVGAAGSGKSVLAKEISGRLGLRHVGLDDLCWRPSPLPWVRIPGGEVQTALKRLLTEERWVIEGAQWEFCDQILRRATTFIWMDLPLGPGALLGILVRTLARMLRREVICNGNRETLGRLLSGNSIFSSALRRRRAHQRELPRMFSRDGDAVYPHVQRIRLRLPADVACLRSRIHAGVGSV